MRLRLPAKPSTAERRQTLCAVQTLSLIHILSNGLARVNPEKCTGCGACEQACPKKVIWIRPESEKPVVMCANHDLSLIHI